MCVPPVDWDRQYPTMAAERKWREMTRKPGVSPVPKIKRGSDEHHRQRREGEDRGGDLEERGHAVGAEEHHEPDDARDNDEEGSQ